MKTKNKNKGIALLLSHTESRKSRKCFTLLFIMCVSIIMSSCAQNKEIKDEIPYDEMSIKSMIKQYNTEIINSNGVLIYYDVLSIPLFSNTMSTIYKLRYPQHENGSSWIKNPYEIQINSSKCCVYKALNYNNYKGKKDTCLMFMHFSSLIDTMNGNLKMGTFKIELYSRHLFEDKTVNDAVYLINKVQMENDGKKSNEYKYNEKEIQQIQAYINIYVGDKIIKYGNIKMYFGNLINQDSKSIFTRIYGYDTFAINTTPTKYGYLPSNMLKYDKIDINLIYYNHDIRKFDTLKLNLSNINEDKKNLARYLKIVTSKVLGEEK